MSQGLARVAQLWLDGHHRASDARGQDLLRRRSRCVQPPRRWLCRLPRSQASLQDPSVPAPPMSTSRVDTVPGTGDFQMGKPDIWISGPMSKSD